MRRTGKQNREGVASGEGSTDRQQEILRLQVGRKVLVTRII